MVLACCSAFEQPTNQLIAPRGRRQACGIPHIHVGGAPRGECSPQGCQVDRPQSETKTLAADSPWLVRRHGCRSPGAKSRAWVLGYADGPSPTQILRLN